MADKFFCPQCGTEMVKVKSPSNKPIAGFTDTSSTGVTITNPPTDWIESEKSEEPEINIAEYECQKCKITKQFFT